MTSSSRFADIIPQNHYPDVMGHTIGCSIFSYRTGICGSCQLALLLAALTLFSSGCEPKNNTHNDVQARQGKITPINLGSARVALTKTSSGDIVRPDAQQELLAHDSIWLAEGSVVEVVRLNPGQFIEINGLKVERGSIKISDAVPRFVEDGIMVVDNFAEDVTGPVGVRVFVTVVRREDGRSIRLGTLTPGTRPLHCVTDIDGHRLAFTVPSGTVDQMDNMISDAAEVSVVVAKLPAKKIPSGLALTVITMSDRVNPPGFRFAWEHPNAFGQYGSGFRIGFVDSELKRDAADIRVPDSQDDAQLSDAQRPSEETLLRRPAFRFRLTAVGSATIDIIEEYSQRAMSGVIVDLTPLELNAHARITNASTYAERTDGSRASLLVLIPMKWKADSVDKYMCGGGFSGAPITIGTSQDAGGRLAMRFKDSACYFEFIFSKKDGFAKLAAIFDAPIVEVRSFVMCGQRISINPSGGGRDQPSDPR